MGNARLVQMPLLDVVLWVLLFLMQTSEVLNQVPLLTVGREVLRQVPLLAVGREGL
jgi:hypothetical protein